jgi:molybdopterin-guanine dinucleotide biosynthesis protein A
MSSGGFLVARLADELDATLADLACAASGGRAHPVFGLWPVRLRENLRRALIDEGIRKVDIRTARHKLVTVSCMEPRHPGRARSRRTLRLDLSSAERRAC